MKNFSRYDLGELEGYEVKVQQLSAEEVAWCERADELLRAIPCRLELVATSDGGLYVADRDGTYDFNDNEPMQSYFGNGVLLGSLGGIGLINTASYEEENA